MKKVKIRVIKEKEIMNELKSENASVTLFVLIVSMFFIAVLLLVNIGLINKNSNQEKQIEQIGKMYSVEEADLEEAYELAIKGNTYPTLAEMEEMINQVKDEMKDQMKTEMEQKELEMEDKVAQAKKDAVLDSYPVGSIYMSISETNPSSKIGGTWVEWGSGRVPVGVDTAQTEFNTIEKTGGNKNMQSHTHTIPVLSGTAASSGAHTHTYSGTTVSSGNHTHTVSSSPGAIWGYCTTLNKLGKEYSAIVGYSWSSTTASGLYTQKVTLSSTGAHTHTYSGTTASSGAHTHSVSTTASTTESTGTGDSQNLQPYITCYMWKRTA